jgi:ATP-binding cassette subfamily B multidrug efflux pump
MAAAAAQKSKRHKLHITGGNRSMLKKLAKSIGQYKKAAIAAPSFIVGEVTLECSIPYVIALLVNRIKAGAGLDVIAVHGGILLLMACCSLAFGAAAGASSATASSGFAKNLRRDLYYRIQTYSFENIDNFSAPSLVTRMTTDVTNVQNAFMMLLRLAIRSPLMFIFAIVMAYVMGGRLSLMFMVVVPILLVGLLIIMRKAMPTFRQVFKKYDKLNESIAENVRGMRVVKSFVRENHEKQKFGDAAEDIRRDFTRAERIIAFNAPLMQFCLYTNMVVVLFFGSQIIISSRGLDLDVGQFSAMLTYGFMILNSLMMLSMVYVMLTMANVSAKRIIEVLEEAPTLASPENAVLDVADGSIEFDGVSFKYSERAERYALSDINLRIESGQTVGILGGTGSSKSTLVQLIPRLYDATLGAVRVGGVDVRKYDLTALRDQVAVVLQKNVLFSGTIKDNLRWGNKDATDEQMIEACKLAQAHDFISAFPDGYDTWIEQGGVNVSGGQKQRLCIARALLKEPKVLILDDSTSAIDTHTDAMLRKALREFIPNTTKLIISQRLASVQEADLIIIMEGGRLAAAGTHEELLRSNEIYREVYNSQNRGGEQNEA